MLSAYSEWESLVVCLAVIAPRSDVFMNLTKSFVREKKEKTSNVGGETSIQEKDAHQLRKRILICPKCHESPSTMEKIISGDLE